ncbi:ABC transporter ATP-binding protein [Paraliobacillus sediminis]|uniref:ABC transporter ATP-binding protein n=1 Tax=Paraliobacillus sediminis TaxID=1885916 RepID=UPI000E3E6A23|nr:ABC transporter ATP-binding protein [Paraliobacillus sediminis]
MEFKSISFSYNQKSNQLKSISGLIEKGKITTIIGPNGCGKSTLLSVLSKDNKPLSGQIVVNDQDINSYKPKELARTIAMVYQQNDGPQDLTVEQLIAFGRVPYKNLFHPNLKKDQEIIDWAIASTRLEEKRNKTLDQLSGGERQRVWIALSLAQKTEFLFLDEPTTFLDIYYQMEILELVRSLNEKYGLTIVMVLHDINQAIRYSDSIIVMKDGKIYANGVPDKIVTDVMMKEIYGVDVAVYNNKLAGLYLVPIGI